MAKKLSFTTAGVPGKTVTILVEEEKQFGKVNHEEEARAVMLILEKNLSLRTYHQICKIIRSR